MAHTTSNPKIHEGRNLKRFREMLAIKQDHLAFELGEDWNQQKSPYSNSVKRSILTFWEAR